MSLIGSLEDLSLGDLLQILSLSRKSGLLLLRSGSGEGRIVLRDGLVCAAFVKGEPEDLRELLVGGGFVSAAEFDLAAETTRRGVPLEEAIVAGTGLAAERVDSLRREHVERAVLRMFGWRSGEFSFEVRGEIEERDAELLLATGINAQYLAIEATRLGDERAEREAGEGDPPPAGGPGLALGSDESEGDRATGGEGSSAAADAEPDPAREVLALAATREGDEGRTGAESEPRLVAIDPDLHALEWLKSALAGLFSRTHIFQRTESGVARIRQYLGRGEVPLVLISENAPADPLTGESDVGDIVRRLRTQAPTMPVLMVGEEGSEDRRSAGAAHALVWRPASRLLADPHRWDGLRETAEALREAVRPWIARAAAGRGPRPRESARPPGDAPSPALRRLERLSARLRDAATRREVLSPVLEFAAESFSRVAMFVVRDGVAVAIAQSGLPRAGGPDDEALREVRVRTDESEWFRAAVEQRGARRAPPAGEADRRLLEQLGGSAPDLAYLAPILSGERAVAILYADNLPGGEPLGDTTALEIALHEAGLALDRILLERALDGARGGEADVP